MNKETTEPKQTTWPDIYKALSEKFPEEAVERTEAAKTKKGYDTTGISYQYVVNRFNEVCGVEGWTMGYKPLKAQEGTFNNGTGWFEITVETTITVGPFPWDEKGTVAVRTHVGGHRAVNYADALKGAITNSLKKTAALFGNGKAAYEGTIDDDNTEQPEGIYNSRAIEAEEKGFPQEQPSYDTYRDGLGMEEGQNTPEPLKGYTCPKCQSPMAQKTSAKGTIWYGCSKYPGCDGKRWSDGSVPQPR